MPRRSFISSTSRRHRHADKILILGLLTMRPCAHCAASHALCVVTDTSEKCEQCVRFNRPYDLASPWAEVDRLLEQRDKLREQRFEAERKAIRLRKQERLLLKKVRALDAREAKNIEEMEAEERAVEAPPSAADPGS